MRSRFSLPLAVTVLSWGFNFVALKLLYLEMAPSAVTLVRFFLMWALLLPVAWALREPLRYPKRKAGLVLLQGGLSMGVYMVLFMEGMRHLFPAEGAILLATSPIFTALLAVACRQEPYRPSVVLGGVVASVGVALVVGLGPGGGGSRWLGAGLLTASAIVWAVSVVLSRPLVRMVSPYRLLVLGMPGALPILLPYGLAATAATRFRDLAPVTWAALAHVTILAGVVGFGGFYAGVRKLGGPGAMLYQYFVTPIAAFFAWLVFGTALGINQVLGISLVIAGVAWAMNAAAKPSKGPSPDVQQVP